MIDIRKPLSIPEIRSKLKSIAADFDLEYNQRIFNQNLVSGRQHALLGYIVGNPHRLLSKYGKTPDKRVKNIDKFWNSEDLKEFIGRTTYGGSVINRKEAFKSIKKIKDPKIRDYFYNLLTSLKDNGNGDIIIIKKQVNPEGTRENRSVLFHE